MLRYFLCDLDETLYAADCGLWPVIRDRINQYMIERLHLPPEEVPALRHHYYTTYGTSLTGLQQHYQIDTADYLQFVHDVPLADYLRPDPALDAMLARLPLQKVIFTNADVPHAQRVMDLLGVTRHFTRIIDITALDFVNKPAQNAYTRALELLQARASECFYADDALRNLVPAKTLGMVTTLVGGRPETPAPDGADYQVPTVHGVERVLASLIGQWL